MLFHSFPFLFFAGRGFSFFDGTNASALGSGDNEMIDGFHGSDTTYARLLLRMASRDPASPRWSIRPGWKAPWNTAGALAPCCPWRAGARGGGTVGSALF